MTAWLRRFGAYWLIMLGIAVRLYHNTILPPGLNIDEAGMGYDAWAILNYGIDQNAIPYPVHLIAWGGGMNALASYLAMPFIHLWGLTVFAIRMPALLLGIAALPAFYYVALKLAGWRVAMLALFMLSISPWHIMASRWGLESNLLPPVFLLGVCALVSERRWLFPLGCLLLALSLYTYGSAYVLVPVFAACLVLFMRRLIPAGAPCWLGAGLFFLISLPIGLFLLRNAMGKETLTIAGLGIPQIPGVPRHLVVSHLPSLADHFFSEAARRMSNLGELLLTQTDGNLYNALPDVGFAYAISLPFMLLGVGIAVRRVWRGPDRRMVPMLVWLGAALLVALLLANLNINRINAIFLPLIFFLAVGLDAFGNRRFALPALVGLYLLCFTHFCVSYFGATTSQGLRKQFNHRLVEALQAARPYPGHICVTNHITDVHIYAMFANTPSPRLFADTVVYNSKRGNFRDVYAFEGYAFGEHCDRSKATAYVITRRELSDYPADRYRVVADYPSFLTLVPRR